MSQKARQFLLSLFLGMGLLFWGQASVAVVKVPIYSVQIPVDAMSAKVREAALPHALRTVLIRVSGDADVTRFDAVTDMLLHASRYLSEYRYEKLPDGSDKPYQMTLQFASGPINAVLTQVGASVWSKDRPVTLIWLAVKNAKEVNLVSGDAVSDVAKLVKQYADERGVPLLFPMLDLTDLRQISANDVWAPFTDEIATVSKRYLPDEILIADIDQSDAKEITARWLLLAEGKQMRWETDGATLDEVIQAGINNIADVLVQQFAGVAEVTDQSSVRLEVMNLQDVSDYAKVLKYLRGLSGVSQVSIIQVLPSRVTFGVSLTTDLSALKRTIHLDSVLQDIKAQEMDEEEDPLLLKYRYQKKGE